MTKSEEFDPPSGRPEVLEDRGGKDNQISQRHRPRVLVYITNIYRSTGSFYSKIISSIFRNKFIPHYVALFLVVIGLTANFASQVQAYYLSRNLTYVEPSTESSIVDAVNKFTPQINDDGTIFDHAKLAEAYDVGFVDNLSTPDTQVTTRVVVPVLPDNSTSTISYTVLQGDTLSGLGWKFGVKIATLKYLNNLNDADLIKPGVAIKVPPKGYEVSAAQIAQRDKENKAKLAAASRTTVTRSSSSNRATSQSGNYAGVINGVKYVRRTGRGEDQCYTYVVSQGYNVSGHYLAKWIPTNSDTPRAGGLVVTYESWAGHVAIVTSVNGDGTFNIRESNYTHGWITERTMNENNGNIKGYVN